MLGREEVSEYRDMDYDAGTKGSGHSFSDALDNLEKQAVVYAELVERLGNRLSPILVPSPLASDPRDRPTPTGSPVADRVRRITGAIEHSNDAVRSITGMIDL